jgi:hypothetical protein
MKWVRKFLLPNFRDTPAEHKIDRNPRWIADQGKTEMRESFLKVD